MFYEDVFRKLSEKQVKYVVVGGIALVLHGVVRMTADLDLLVQMDKENITKFILAMEELGYKPKAPVSTGDLLKSEVRTKWRNEKGMVMFPFFHPQKPFRLIDIFLDEPLNYNEVDRDKKIINAKGTDIPLISINHLKQLKSKAGRKQDLVDIAALEELEELVKNEQNP